VVAYSTCSQLGYMFFAAGVGAYGAAMFHLFTHAFFKALLFLGAGSVIHAMHHEQDMRYYGGLVRRSLHLLGDGDRDRGDHRGRDRRHRLRRFWSKDAILEASWASGSVSGTVAFWLGAIAALMTSFYSLAADLHDLLRRAALGRVRAYPARRPPRP
jgi:NADH-quinone oxidoreductase subunit L